MARALVACALLLLCSSAALAQPAPAEPLELEWRGEPSCGDAGGVRAGALELLGEATPRRRVTARATVQRDAQGWQVRVETESEGEHGTRELRGESCGAVQRAVSLVLAMMLESEPPPAPASVPPPAAEPPAPPPLAPPPPRVDAAPVERAPVERRRGLAPRWLLGPELSAGAGSTPELGVGLGGLAAVVLGRVELGVAGRYWLARERLAPIDDPGRPGQRISRQELELYGCFTLIQLARPELALSGCLAPGLNRISAEAVRASGGPDPHSLWAPALSGALRLRYFPVGNVFAGLTPALTWSRRQELSLEVGQLPDAGGTPANPRLVPVYSTPDVFFRFALEIGARF